MWDLNFFKRTNRKETTEDKLINNINNALTDVYHARSNFDMAIGEDNIELAIYQLSTAEIKYQNLIREAKRLGVLQRGLPGCAAKEADENQCG